METIMCRTTIGTLTLAGMLEDPLIHAVMRSDKVSDADFAALWFRVKDRLADRDGADRDGADRDGIAEPAPDFAEA